MDYFKLVGTCRTVGLPVKMEGIGDEPMMPVSDGATLLSHRPSGVLLPGTKIDQHASFPKGLPKAFELSDQHLRD